jgi:pathogenesis-related protein 1
MIHHMGSSSARKCVDALAILAIGAISLFDSAHAADARAESLPLDGAVVEKWIAAHNDVRARVSPVPDPPLGALVWSEEAAGVARDWAARCRFEHNTGRGALGENVFASSEEAPPDVVEQAIASWAAEEKDFDVVANRCAAGAECGHYTQLVWRATRGVGCAVATCTTGSPVPDEGAWTLVVCNYAPPGNIVGEKPY